MPVRYSVLLVHVSAVYISHHQVGISLQKMNKEDSGLS